MKGIDEQIAIVKEYLVKLFSSKSIAVDKQVSDSRGIENRRTDLRIACNSGIFKGKYRKLE